MPNEAPPLIVQVYAVALFLAGVACLTHFLFFFRGRKKIEPQRAVPGWRLSFPDFFIGLTAIILIVMFVQVVIAAIAPTQAGADGRAWELVLFGFGTHMTALAALFFFFKSQPVKFRDPFDSRGLGWGRSFVVALYSYLAVFPLLALLTLGWQSLLEGLGREPAPQETVMIFTQVEQFHLLVLMIVLTIVLAPVSEEILFRGCLYRFIKAKTSIVVALLLSGVLFSLLHHNLLGFLPLLLLGVALAYSYEMSGSIKVPILFHGIFNLNTVLILVLTGNAG